MLGATVMAAGFAVVALGAASSSPEEVRGAARRALEGDVQRTLPGEDAPGAAPPAVVDPNRDRRRRTAPPPPFLAGLANLLLWVVIVVGVVIVVLFLGRELAGYLDDRSARAPPADAPAGVPHPVTERPLGDADVLAREGRFAEAIHVLLLRTLEALIGRLPERLPESLTSREIVRRVALPDEARHALGVLVGAAEASHFGEHVPGDADYATCRAEFQRFATAFRTGVLLP